MKINFIGILLFTALNSFAQKSIKGFILDINNKPVCNANILLENNTIIKKIARSQADGSYQLSIDDFAIIDGFTLKITCIGFITQNKLVLPGILTYSFNLQNSVVDIDKVIVKSKRPPIRFQGDTISYDVKKFADSLIDTKIADVLKKIPGIEVAENGQIKYRGAAISYFYIDGDDVLGDRYNIATNNINTNMVDQIEVLENNQPVKVLQGIVKSEKTAINLKLKKGNFKVIKDVDGGLGYEKKFDAQLNLLGFKPLYKFINTAKGNNRGVDYAYEIQKLNLSDIQSKWQSGEINPLLQIGIANVMNMQPKYYLNTKGLLLSLNQFIKFAPGRTIRLNNYLQRGNNAFNQNNFTNYFINGFSFRNDQISKKYLTQNLSQNEISFTLNEKKAYISLELNVDRINNNDNDLSILNSNEINNILKTNFSKAALNLNGTLLQKNGKLLNVVSKSTYYYNNQNFSIEPGNLKSILNNNTDYFKSRQFINVNSFYTENRISETFLFSNIQYTVEPKIIINYQNVVSKISVSDSQYSEKFLDYRFQNNLNFLQLWNTLGNRIAYQTSLSSLLGEININYLTSEYRNLLIAKTKQGNVFATGRMVFIKNLTPQRKITASYNYNKSFNQFKDLLSGYIIKGNNNIESSDVSNTNNLYHTFSVSYNHNKTAKLFFSTIGAEYSIANKNTINFDSTTNSIAQRIALPYRNNQNGLKLNLYISRYIFALTTTATLKINYSFGSAVQFQNYALFNTKYKNLVFSANTVSKISDNINIQCGNSFSVNENKIDKTNIRNKQWSIISSAAFYYKITKLFYCAINSDYYVTGTKNTSTGCELINLLFNKNFKKQKMSIELSVQNIFNQNLITFQNVSAFTNDTRQVFLQKRFALVKFKFSF